LVALCFNIGNETIKQFAHQRGAVILGVIMSETFIKYDEKYWD